jgi:hypothetical protein
MLDILLVLPLIGAPESTSMANEIDVRSFLSDRGTGSAPPPRKNVWETYSPIEPETWDRGTMISAVLERAEFREVNNRADVLIGFASKMATESKDLEPAFAKVIDEEFWNLL